MSTQMNASQMREMNRMRKVDIMRVNLSSGVTALLSCVNYENMVKRLGV